MSKINYRATTEGRTKIHTITWKVLNITNIVDNKNTREMQSEETEGFQVKMLFLGHNNYRIKIYYLTPNPVILKSILHIHTTNTWDLCIMSKGIQKIQVNDWQYSATLFKHEVGIFNLILKFQFTVPNYIKVKRSYVPETELCKDLQGLLSDGLYSDVTMRSSDYVDFKVHKGVLASRSAVLKAHFEHNTIECNTNVIDSPLASEVLDEVLYFIYTNNAPEVDKMPEELLVAADYYQLSRLVNLCEEALHKKLTVDNAMKTLQLADLHSANRLKQLTLEFIKDGQAKLITKTEGWAKVKSLELIKQIYEYVMED